jgi:hypothetical protein
MKIRAVVEIRCWCGHLKKFHFAGVGPCGIPDCECDGYEETE